MGFGFVFDFFSKTDFISFSFPHYVLRQKQIRKSGIVTVYRAIKDYPTFEKYRHEDGHIYHRVSFAE